jgi:hypothetical protein
MLHLTPCKYQIKEREQLLCYKSLPSSGMQRIVTKYLMHYNIMLK